jgi:hypothetical protein
MNAKNHSTSEVTDAMVCQGIGMRVQGREWNGASGDHTLIVPKHIGFSIY